MSSFLIYLNRKVKGSAGICEHKYSVKQADNQAVLTGSVLLHLVKGPQQSTVALVTLIVLGVQQDFLGINKQARDSENVQRYTHTIPVRQNGETLQSIAIGLNPMRVLYKNVRRQATLETTQSMI